MIRWLNRDLRTIESRVWERWFNRVPRIRKAFAEYVDDDPLYYNETATVSVFASAASQSQLVAFSEYVSEKGEAADRRRTRGGRGDLWVLSPKDNRSWAFEFKQVWAREKCRASTIEKKLNMAVDDARCVRSFEADFRFGALLIVPWGCEALSRPSLGALEGIASEITAAVRFGGGRLPAYLLIQRI